jgi:hypothetical protein
LLPPPGSFHGPHVVVEKLCDIFDSLRLPDVFTPSSTGEGHSVKVSLQQSTLSSTKLFQLFDLAKSVQWMEGAGKRRRGGGREDSDDEAGEAPSNDIYRKRMHKKIK